jgi:hypothetical protein
MSNQPNIDKESVEPINHRVEPEPKKAEKKRNPSLFGPIVLIAIGSVFLLANLDMLPGRLYWEAALRLWPLLLVFIGLNLIVRQIPGALGSFLSALIGIVAVLTFGYVLLFADQIPFVQAGEGTTAVDIQRDVPISYALDGIDSADISIDLNMVAADLYTLEDSSDLINGTVTYIGDLIFEVDQNGNSADVKLDTTTADFWFFNPGNWTNFNNDDRWQIGLSPDVALDLHLDGASGSYDADLGRLFLTDFELDAGSGSGDIIMPGGNYEASIDGGSGSVYLVLPRGGEQLFVIDGGSGSFTLVLPDSMEARFEVDHGSGAFNPGSRLQQIDGDSDNSVWQTVGYGSSQNQIVVELDIGSGAASVETAEQGR